MCLQFCAMTTTPIRPRATRALPTTAVPINGAALREIRKRSGVSVADLAKEIGVSRPYVTKIEVGHSRRVSPEVYARLLKALDIRTYGALLAAAEDVA